MNYRRVAFVLVLGLFSPLLMANAAKVANLAVTGNSEDLNILWDRLSSTDFGNAEGYALQWSDRQSEVKITQPINIYQEGNLDDRVLRRASFEDDRFYYLRVYTYALDSNQNKFLGNGSDMLKFKISFQNEVTKENITIIDPIVSNNDSSEDVTSDFDFGALRKYPYDVFTDFFWSSPREMVASDYDGFVIALSKNSDMATPLIEAQFSRDDSRMRLTGLAPETQYYAQGSFYKDQGGEIKKFGESSVKAFKTITAVPRDASTSGSRNILKVERRAIRKVDVNDTSSTTASTNTSSSTSTSTSTSSSNSNTTVTTSSQSDIDSADQAAVKRKVSDLKRQISALQSELRRWEAKVEGSSTSRTTSASTKSSSGLSLRERLKLILEAKRNK